MKLLVTILLINISPLTAMHSLLVRPPLLSLIGANSMTPPRPSPTNPVLTANTNLNPLISRNFSSHNTEIIDSSLQDMKKKLARMREWQEHYKRKNELRTQEEKRCMSACHDRLCLVKGCQNSLDCIFRFWSSDDDTWEDEYSLEKDIETLELLILSEE